MLCVSTNCAVARCPSVTLVNCIHTAEDIIKLLSLPASPTILVFLTPIHKSKGIPSAGAQSTRGWENFAIFN